MSHQMEKYLQSWKLLPVALLLIITPLLSSSLRFKYLYFIVNILIISLGAEAGLLSFFLQSQHNKKPTPSSQILTPQKPLEVSSVKEDVSPVLKPVEKCSTATEKALSIFFIGDQSSDHAQELMEDNNDEDQQVGDQELFQKAEVFIGNFYKQLKLQRQHSWNKLHFSQKAF